jgi:hypothetical protein
VKLEEQSLDLEEPQDDVADDADAVSHFIFHDFSLSSLSLTSSSQLLDML